MLKTSVENDEEKKSRYDEMGRPESRRKEEVAQTTLGDESR
jgi:hypothetical protein